MSNAIPGLPFGYLIVVVYWTVLMAELVGDKSIYTVSSLSLRYRPPIVLGSLIVAFSLKMLAAVLLGRVMVQLNSRWTDLISAAAFFLSAFLIWFEEPKLPSDSISVDRVWWRAALVCFASLFFTEWGDPGQISVAALTMKSQAPLAAWMGGTLAMVTKGTLAMIVGVKLGDHLPQRTLRTVASVSCGLLGFLALGGILVR
jgi:Ca2+/H+ antiporter, TMEM165/GDT1 family